MYVCINGLYTDGVAGRGLVNNQTPEYKETTKAQFLQKVK
jgi:hypothetical protein